MSWQSSPRPQRGCCIVIMTVLSGPVLSSQQSRRNEISTLIAKIAGSLQGKEGEFVENIPRVVCKRRRRSVSEVYANIGPIYFRRAYRMTYSSFIHLHRRLYYGIKEAARVLKRYKKKGLKTDTNTPPPIPNGRISTSVCSWLVHCGTLPGVHLMIS